MYRMDTARRSGEENPLSNGEFRDRLRELATSAKLVAKVVVYEGESDSQVLVQDSRLPKWTVWCAVGRLRDEHLIRARPKVSDPRKLIYGLNTTGPDGPFYLHLNA